MINIIFVVDDDAFLEEISISNIFLKKYLEDKALHFSPPPRSLNSRLNFWATDL